jgi:nuclear GTP-binding protein
MLFYFIDLVPRENVEVWLKHLRNEFPTLAFKASTQIQQTNLVSEALKILLRNYTSKSF